MKSFLLLFFYSVTTLTYFPPLKKIFEKLQPDESFKPARDKLTIGLRNYFFNCCFWLHDNLGKEKSNTIQLVHEKRTI